jgi:adenylate cyclase, class 2
MAINWEQKYRSEDAEAVIRLCEDRAFRFHAQIHQVDQYFHVEKGRLKLRTVDDRETELIFYVRPDGKGPRKSEYSRLPLGNETRAIADVLKSALGIVGVIVKDRTVYYNQSVRIHIDRVRGLGEFVELEAEVGCGRRSGDSRRLLRETAAALKLETSAAMGCSYADMLPAGG